MVEQMRQNLHNIHNNTNKWIIQSLNSFLINMFIKTVEISDHFNKRGETEMPNE